jgi:hypothetical protein
MWHLNFPLCWAWRWRSLDWPSISMIDKHYLSASYNNGVSCWDYIKSVWSSRGMILTTEIWTTECKPVGVTLSTNPTRTVLVLSPGFRGKKSAIIRVSQGKPPLQTLLSWRYVLTFRANYCLHPPNRITSDRIFEWKTFCLWQTRHKSWCLEYLQRITSPCRKWKWIRYVCLINLLNQRFYGKRNIQSQVVGGWWIAVVFNYMLTCRIIYFFSPIDWQKKSKYSSYSDYHDIIIWEVITCSLSEKHEPFRGTCWLHIWGHTKT